MSELVTAMRDQFADRVKQSRQRLGLSRVQVCARMPSQPTPSSYSYWEKGTIPRLETLHELAEALEVSAAYLQGTTPDDDPTEYPRLSDAYLRGGDFALKRIQADHEVAASSSFYKRLGLNMANVIWVPVSDSSMAPTLSKGDKVMIDLDNKLPRERALYALMVEDRLWFRWIQPELNRSYSVFEEGDASKAVSIAADQLDTLQIAGRVTAILHVI